MPRISQRTFAAAIIVFSALIGLVILRDPHRGAYDFQAFYCAGRAVRDRADPYLAQPLGACEHRQTDATYAQLPPGVVLPAPQPPYDIASFALLAALPFDVAKAVWGAILAACIAIAIFCTIGATRAPPGAVFMSFAASLILPSLAFGELFGLFAAAAFAAMLFCAKGRYAQAGIAAAASLVEPHLGAPLCIALFVWKAQTRVPIALFVAFLVAVSLTVSGVHQSLEYLTTVLPLHALSEVTSNAQLSLTAVLHAFGVSDSAAVRAGMLSYVAMAALGIWCGRSLAARFGSDAFLVAVPAAFATIGGTFMHVTEFFAAIPLALLVLERTSGYRRAAALASLVLLSVPWYAALDGGIPIAFAAVAALVVFYHAWQTGGNGLLISSTVALAVCAVLLFAAQWDVHAMRHVLDIRSTHINPAYAQASWRALNDSALSGGDAISWLLRGASWLGLAALAAASARRLTVNVN